jgi:hypothetical protein
MSDDDGAPGPLNYPKPGQAGYARAKCPHCSRGVALRRYSQKDSKPYWECETKKCGRMQDSGGSPGELFSRGSR